MRTSIAILLLSLPWMAQAQSTNISTLFMSPAKKGDHFFKKLAYRNALHIYLHAHDRKPDDAYLIKQVAECYFNLHDPATAEEWYRKLQGNPALDAPAKFDYAEALSQNGKYDESKAMFEEYLKERPSSNMAKEKIEFLNRITHYLSDTSDFAIFNADFNTEHSEYGAHYFHGGIAFASSRDNDYLIEHKAMDAVSGDESLLNMYYVEGLSHGEHKLARLLHADQLKSFLHEGPMAFYNNDKKAAFTRTNMTAGGRPIRGKDKQAHLQIYFADVARLYNLSNIRPFEHNDRDYSLAHPTVSPDGSTMYFSSTQPGGLGGSDIYVSSSSNGEWSRPANLGPVINTEGDESFPFLAADSILYFSSNGHGSLGGLDIMVSYKKNGVFGKPVNLGSPMNTRFDDFSFVADSTGRAGYFASNREGGRGLDDIYYFSSRAYFLVGRSVDTRNEILQGVKLVAINKATGQVADSTVSDQNGYFHLRLTKDNEYTIIASRPGYQSLKEVAFNTSGIELATDAFSLPLWKETLFAKGKVYDNETQQELTGVSVLMRNEDTKQETKMDLNDLTAYELKLRPESRFTLTFSKPGYVAKTIEINTRNRDTGEILYDLILEREFMEMTTISFDYRKSAVKDEFKPMLDKIVSTLQALPESKLSITAHADSRGSVGYNQQLTNSRARNTMKYITSKGIKTGRITWKGFGEQLILNQCKDGVKCTEDEHKINRRAEIKVVR